MDDGQKKVRGEIRKTAPIIKSGYENVTVVCPACGKEIIFNRVTDLKTVASIDSHPDSCPSCCQPFNINGDTIQVAPHLMFLDDCAELIAHKQYMQSVLIVAQAYEMFFSFFLHLQLLYKPFVLESKKNQPEEVYPVDRVNRSGKKLSLSRLGFFNYLANELFSQIKKLQFEKMRNLFLRQAIFANPPKTLREAEQIIINCLNAEELSTEIFTDNVDRKYREDSSLAQHLRCVAATKINTLRNNVVHKQAYRPERQEAEDALKEARGTLPLLTYRFLPPLELSDMLIFFASPPLDAISPRGREAASR